MTAVASAILREVTQPDFLHQLKQSSEYLRQELTLLSEQFSLGKVRGEGLLLALDTGDIDAMQIAATCMEQGLLVNAPRANTLRFVPALNLTKVEVDEMIRRLSLALTKNLG
uniref:Acetylornithine/succinyldiaminopimelateaminotran sferase n=1 Tax=uncultured Thiotrichaceae bacterium TaxID=298394 RepID=A0A6S6UM28_9GAMM|nr:MAG: Acetylornithine/succinyldiaminopimelateaminotran sferase [uncultured Thiotrichaceae bacterium]